MNNFLLRIAQVVVLIQLVPLVAAALFLRIVRNLKHPKARSIVFGGPGLINYKYWCEALRFGGWDASTMVWGTPSILDPGTFEFDLQSKFGRLAYLFAPYAFIKAIARFQIVWCGFDGFLLGTTILRPVEPWLIKLAGCKLIAVPYGGDAYVYSNVRSGSWAHALQVSYPQAARHQRSISGNIHRMTKRADFMMPGVMGFDGIGRWDVLSPSPLCINALAISPNVEKHSRKEMVVIHTPNHRGCKGTEFLVQAVENLRKEGCEITLRLLEGIPNKEVLRQLSDEADVLVEQLIFQGYAMSGVEGLAAGTVVVANLSDEKLLLPFRRWSFLDECPVVSGTPESIESVLRLLYFDPLLRNGLSIQGREYALKFHSYAAFIALYREIEKLVFDERGSMINFYSPNTESTKPTADPSL